MPSALADWKEIETLFMAGLEATDIAKQTGLAHKTVLKQIERKRWRQKRSQAQQMALEAKLPRRLDGQLTEQSAKFAVSHGVVSNVLNNCLSENRATYIAKMAEAGANIAQSLSQSVLEAPTLAEKAEAFAMVEPASRVLKAPLGLDQPQVQINQAFAGLDTLSDMFSDG